MTTTQRAIQQTIIQPAHCRRKKMTYEYILTEKEEGVAILTMNRPAQLNAMNRQLSSELHDAVTQMVADDDIGCIVITGAGERAFTAGGGFIWAKTEEIPETHRGKGMRGAAP